MTTIMRCHCYHAAQDSLHGVGLRAHNERVKWARNGKSIRGKNDPEVKGWRCTVCGETKR